METIGQVRRIEQSDKSYFVSYAVGVNTDPGDETALVIEGADRPHFFILNGNWVKEYEVCKNKRSQVALFRREYSKHGGFWSESLDELEEVLKHP